MWRTVRLNSLLMIGGLVACLPGCASFPESPLDIPWTESKPEFPDRILSVWADTILHQPGRPGVRGFGGRLYFYREGVAEPVKVAGSIRVYVFNGESTDPQRAAPLKVFAIRLEDLGKHHSKTSLGHSYNIWVPWDVVGGPNRVLSLIVRFDGINGGTVMGEPSTELLPGVSAAPPESHVQQVSHVELVEANPVQDRLTSLTIDLPPSFQRRLQQVPFQSPGVQSPTNHSSRDRSPASGYEGARRGPISQDAAGRDAESYRAQRGLNGASEVEAITPARQTTGRVINQPRAGIVSTGFATNSGRPIETAQTWEEANGSREALLQAPQVSGQADYYAPRRFPARREPRVQPGRPPLRRSPHPAGWPSSLPPTPRNGTGLQNSLNGSIPVESGWQR